MINNHVYIFCSDKARNGKTLLARLFLGFLTLSPDNPFHIFDTNYPGGDLARHFPENSEIIDFSKTGGHVRLFDHIMSNPTMDYMVDLQSEFLVKFFDILTEIEFPQALESQAMRVIVYYLVDETASSYETAVETFSRTPDVEFIPVHNKAISPPFNLKQISRDAGQIDAIAELVMPHFSAEMLEFLNRPTFDLTRFILGTQTHEDAGLNRELMILIKGMYENKMPDSKGNMHMI